MGTNDSNFSQKNKKAPPKRDFNDYYGLRISDMVNVILVSGLYSTVS